MQQKYIYVSCKTDNGHDNANCQWCEATEDGPRSQESVTSLNNDGVVIVRKQAIPHGQTVLHKCKEERYTEL